MVRITEELVRKKAEHNECEIGTLEELSLHQEDVERIEHLQHWCKNLQILLLQSNLISKIENLHKLKKLEYLNLALNNIEKIENLERCESLNKLDLTLNFIGELTSVDNLKNNIHLQILYLTGNPCCDYNGYREYVICTLTQIDNLDGTEITRTERIKAFRDYNKISESIIVQQKEYAATRQKQKQRLEKWLEEEVPSSDDEEANEKFWQCKTEHAPEVRTVIAHKSRRQKEKTHSADTKKESVRGPLKFFTNDGRPLNINQTRMKFHFSDENPNVYVLDIAVYKFLDTSLIQVDVEPNYVRAIIKGKVFQLVIPEEIATAKSEVKRSQITGHLVITLPKIKQILTRDDSKNVLEKTQPREGTQKENIERENKSMCGQKYNRREMLEIGPIDARMDFSKIIENKLAKRTESVNFVDNPEVPPLE